MHRPEAGEATATAGAGFDPSSDPRFVEYYDRASRSGGTLGRFARIIDRAVELMRDEKQPTEGLAVLDIGCGAGTQAAMWAAAGHQVKAIDINEALVALACARAREHGLNITYAVGSATRLPFASNAADIVLLAELLEHVVEWEDCLKEAARVLRPGGLLFVSTTNCLCPHQQEFNLVLYSWYPGRLKRWCELKAMTSHPQWANHARYPAVHWFSYYALRRWFARHGFRTLDRFDVLLRNRPPGLKGVAAEIIRRVPAACFLGHLAIEGTMVWAIKGKAN